MNESNFRMTFAMRNSTDTNNLEPMRNSINQRMRSAEGFGYPFQPLRVTPHQRLQCRFSDGLQKRLQIEYLEWGVCFLA
jgi:hypothetical protein